MQQSPLALVGGDTGMLCPQHRSHCGQSLRSDVTVRDGRRYESCFSSVTSMKEKDGGGHRGSNCRRYWQENNQGFLESKVKDRKGFVQGVWRKFPEEKLSEQVPEHFIWVNFPLLWPHISSQRMYCLQTMMKFTYLVHMTNRNMSCMFILFEIYVSW